MCNVLELNVFYQHIYEMCLELVHAYSIPYFQIRWVYWQPRRFHLGDSIKAMCLCLILRQNTDKSIPHHTHGHMICYFCVGWTNSDISLLKHCRWPINSPHKVPVTRKMFPFHDVIAASERNQIEFELIFREKYHIQCIPRNMHTVFALLCFVVVIHWLIFPYPPGLLHWHCGNLTIVPVPAKQPWWIWINTSCEFIINDCITTTKQSTAKPCAYFLGYTVHHMISHKPSFCRVWSIYGNISDSSSTIRNQLGCEIGD